MMPKDVRIIKGDALDLLSSVPHKSIHLVATDPPYAFGGSGTEHAITATVAVVLRESALRLVRGGWMIVLCASSWRAQQYMVESTRGTGLEAVRVGTWVKPRARSKVRTGGWSWASVSAIVMRKGKGLPLPDVGWLDWIEAEPITNGRRAQLPEQVCAWAVEPFATPGGSMLDPFAGAGGLVRAAQACGMQAQGFELNPPPAGVGVVTGACGRA